MLWVGLMEGHLPVPAHSGSLLLFFSLGLIRGVSSWSFHVVQLCSPSRNNTNTCCDPTQISLCQVQLPDHLPFWHVLLTVLPHIASIGVTHCFSNLSVKYYAIPNIAFWMQAVISLCQDFQGNLSTMLPCLSGTWITTHQCLLHFTVMRQERMVTNPFATKTLDSSPTRKTSDLSKTISWPEV